MSESVYDASFVAYANCALDDPIPERRAFLLALVSAIEGIISGRSKLRWNNTLHVEYCRLVKEHRNDVIDQFFAILAGENAIYSRNTLRKHEYVKADKCDWPGHDRHLIAAAIDGEQVTINVTEKRLGQCKKAIWKTFEIRVNYVAVVLPEATAVTSA